VKAAVTAAVTVAVAVLAVALPGDALAVVGQADATVYLKGFRVADAGANIKWGITICSNRRVRVRAFSATLDPESVGVRYTRKWGGGVNGADCERWTLTAPDVWTEQVWYSRLTVVLADGRLLRTNFRAFYID
jgi:hypothetical protein